MKIKNQKLEERSMEQEINDLEDLINDCETDDDIIQRYEELKHKIDALSESKANNDLFKSKAMWVEEGEKAQSIFLV